MKKDCFHQSLANTLIKHRKSAGLTQLELADLAGVGKTVVYDLEHAKPGVRLETLLKILHVLNIKINIESPIHE